MADVMRSSPEEEPEAMREVSGGRSARRPRGGKQKKGSFWRELPILIVTAVVLTILIQTFLARVYVIPSQSMELTLHGCTGCQDDRVLVDKLSYRFSSPQPGNVVVFRGPPSWVQNEFSAPQSTNPLARVVDGGLSLIGFGSPDEKDFIKRVIATGGQTVACCDAQNRVTVDGKPLNEPYVYFEPGKERREQLFGPVTVPPGELWVMGDNRNDSDDSRFQGGGGVNGAVPVQDVIGRARFIVLPPTRWHGISQPNPQMSASAAPAWQSGVPVSAGLASAFPVVWLGRRLVGVRTHRRSQE